MKRIKIHKAAFSFLIGLFFFGLSLNGQVTYVVNTTDGLDDGLCNEIHCSLREAVNASNTNGVESFIYFNLAGDSTHTIKVDSTLELTENNITIDGTTQSGNSPMDGKIQLEPNFSSDIHKVFDVSGDNITIKGLKFLPNNRLFHILDITGNKCTLESNYIGSTFRYFGPAIFGYQTTCDSLMLLNNYFYDIFLIFRFTSNQLSNPTFIGNTFGRYPDGTTASMSYGLFLEPLTSGKVTILNNRFHNCQEAALIANRDITYMRGNLFTCNQNSIVTPSQIGIEPTVTKDPLDSICGTATPIITTVANDSIYGTGTAGDSIEIYRVIDSLCSDAPCQGGELLGTGIIRPNGTWSVPTPSSIQLLDKITSLAFNSQSYVSSDFSNCKVYEDNERKVTYWVNTTDDLDDGLCDEIHCSLREAVNASNASGGFERFIYFNLAGDSTHTIKLGSTLELIENNITIDGTTQSGNSPMDGKIRLEPNFSSDTHKVFDISGDNITIKGLNFLPNSREVPILDITGNKCKLESNYISSTFRYSGPPVFGFATICDSLTLSNNYFYNTYNIFNFVRNQLSNPTFIGNTFGRYPDGTTASMVYGLYLEAITSGKVTILNNRFHNCQEDALVVNRDITYMRGNLFTCNRNSIVTPSQRGKDSLDSICGTATPIITRVAYDSIYGTGTAGDSIEIYRVIDSLCSDASCQGGELLGTGIIRSNGTWSVPTTSSIRSFDKITSLAFNSQSYVSSDFSNCKVHEDNEKKTTYWVNTTDDLDDGFCDEVHCSLREAVIASNASGGVERFIYFNLAGDSTHTIVLGNPLKLTANNIIIDGTTQSGNSPMDGKIRLEPNFSSDVHKVFDISGDNITIKGFHFLPSSREVPILDITGNKCKLESNYIGSTFRYFGPAVFGITTTCDSLMLLNNYFYDIFLLFGATNNHLSNPTFIGNTFGRYPDETTAPMSFGLFLEPNTSGKVTILNNRFHNCQWAALIVNHDITYMRGNIFTCNQNSIATPSQVGAEPTVTKDPLDSICGTAAPVIITIASDSIYGTGVAGDSIEIYRVLDSLCSGTQCQGGELLETGMVRSNGTWSIPTPSSLRLFDKITSLAFNSQDYVSSNFSTCKIVFPTDCGFAESLTLNKSPCSGVGTILDLAQMNPLELGDDGLSTSSCSTTFKGKEAWFSVKVPSSGNFLVRTNISNTVVPVIEIYTECQTNPLPECEILDTIPYIMVFENYTPDDILYLRVWDKNNEVVDDENKSAFLHLTAHELDLDKSKWEICDYEDLIDDNPTNLVRREAATFILDYEPNTPQSEIDQNTAELIEEGLELQKECYCGNAPIQLWGTDNPVELDRRRVKARKRACVDTTNYNYIFETVEFQVNSYAIGQQYDTDITMDTEGNFVMVWKDEQRRHNYGRAYLSSGNPISVEFPIGASDKTQFASKVAMLPNGDFMVVWHEINPVESSARALIYGRLFDANGLPRNAAFNISTPAAITASTPELREIAKYGTNPQISVAANGNFVVVWYVDRNIFAQRFDESGERIGNLIEVATSFDSNYEPTPSISLNDLGAFIITWTGKDADETGIYGQRFAANGNKISLPFLVNTTQLKEQTRADVILKNDGAFIVVWESFEQVNDTADYDIYGQLFAADASKIGGEFRINDYTYFAQSNPSLALFDNGNFLVAWNSDEQDGFAEGIYAKLFDATANPIPPSFDDSDKGSVGEEFRMNTYNDPQQKKPRTATNGETIFMGAWEDGANDGSFEGIFAQRYENILIGGNNIFYPIGTATPSTLLGDELTYPTTNYTPSPTADKVVKVAILDTGIDHEHALIQNAIWNNPEVNDGDNCLFEDEIGYDFINEVGTPIDFDGHGTQINGMLARDFDRNVKLELMNLKFHELDRGSVFDAICGIYYAVDNGADILNLSWGFEAPEEPVVLKKALQYAADHDVLIVTTAGNTSKNNDRINKYPANLDIPNMIVVTAYEYKKQTGAIKLANYASHGQNNVDIAAYGFVETAQKGGAKTLAAGTSMAAPAVARTAATIKGLYPELTATEIKDCILSTAATVASLNDKVATGGILNHNAAVDCAYEKAISGCRTNLILDKQNLDSKTYQSNDYLKSTATIEKDSTVIFTANSFINLLPGFHAKAASDFTAKIEGCSMDLLPPSTDDVLFSPINSTSALPIKTTIYPNPTKDRVYISLQKETLGFDLALFNAVGQEINSQSSLTNQTYLDVSHLPTGIYFLRINNTLTERLIIGEN